MSAPLLASVSDLPQIWQPLLAAAIFGILGILLMVLGYKVFDWITPKIDVQHELANKQNIAVAIVIGSVFVGVAIVIAASMS